MSVKQHYSIKEIAHILNVDYTGDALVKINGIATLQSAQPGQISFLDNPRYHKFLPKTQASAVIVSPKFAQDCPVSTIIVDDPYLAYAKIATLFAKQLTNNPGVHPSASIGNDCHIHPSAVISAHCTIGSGVTIGKNTVVGASCVIGEGSKLGEACVLHPHVTLYHDITIGDRVMLHSGVVVGSDGFGMANQQGKWIKIPQLGRVVIGNDVEIGASTTIDRGAIEDTVIEQGVKLDNQIQVGHNVHIGAHTAIAACSGISGSTKIGKYCRISGMVGFTGHFEVADHVVITGMTVVSKPITKPGIYSSGTPIEPHYSWRKNAVRFRQLDEMHLRLKTLEKQLTALSGEKNS